MKAMVEKTPLVVIVQLLGLLCCISSLFGCVNGHGYLSSPRSRNFVAYAGQEGSWYGGNSSTPPAENCPHCLNRQTVINGTLSRCGRSSSSGYTYDSPLSILGTPLGPKIQATYVKGQDIDLEVVLTTHHKGHFTYSACALQPGESAPTQQCFDSNPLMFVKDNLYGGPYDPYYPDRAYIAATTFPGIQTGGDPWGHKFSHRFRLPAGLSGNRVLIQWHYWTANSCVYPGYRTLTWPPNFFDSNDLSMSDCTNISLDGNGVPEQFWNCAEVTILDSPLAPIPLTPVAPVQPPLQPVAAPKQPTANPIGPILSPVKPAPSVFNPAPAVSAPSQCVCVCSPMQLMPSPLNPGLTPSKPVSQPSNQVSMPQSKPVSQPSKPVSKPQSKPFSQPSKPVSKPQSTPLSPVLKPVTPLTSPSKPVLKPLQPIAVPSIPLAKPVMPMSAPLNPVAKPTQPVPQPTNTSPSVSILIPPGPYITSQNKSEVINIPDPIPPSIQGPRSNCPHLTTPLRLWNDTTTWAGLTPPGPGVDVTLPLNSNVLVAQSVFDVLGIVTIPTTSKLIFGENPAGIQFHARGMDIKGQLVAGSETCLLQTPLTITLYGSRPSDAVTNPPPSTYKGIDVSGVLELHGKQYHRTWTRLAKTALPGDKVLLLQDQVNWEPGQNIVLVTTAMKDSREWHQNEVLTISSLGTNPPPGVGAVVYLASSVTYRHLAIAAYQAEVGLLSRMITIQGNAADSEPTDPDPLTCTYVNYPSSPSGVQRWIYGSQSRPCPNKELTGFGGHIMVNLGGVGRVEGVQLYRMGQTNVLGRYPMHFHLLGNCPSCYFRHSSVYRSFYRCISIHGTHFTTVSENVAYDITGYCYYLEDGIEEDNTISFNLAALVHFLGEAPWGWGQETQINKQSSTLTNPADVTAAGFYITNIRNYIIGNAASGGYAGFAFPFLQRPIGASKNVVMNPTIRTGLTVNGNTAHSTGWWWYHAAAFYFSGSLYYDSDGVTLVYNAGRDQSRGFRRPCKQNMCATSGGCDDWCPPDQRAWIQLHNSKAFLTPANGLNSWSGRMEILGFEVHDMGLSLEALEAGFWVDRLLAQCRTGEPIAVPAGVNIASMLGNGFFWYDTNQEHIISNSTFRQCGYRSANYNQYDQSPTRGCGDNTDSSKGCSDQSTVFGFLTHSDQFNPEVMQGTRQIIFQSCGRRFKLQDYRGTNYPSTVSGRLQNWVDSDGTASGLNEPTLIGSGLSDANLWWKVEPSVVEDAQGPLKFIKKNNGPERGIGHFNMQWDFRSNSIHNQIGGSVCGNGSGAPCPALGWIKHAGPMFQQDNGLPVTANADIAGPVGGWGWELRMNQGAPKTIKLQFIEVTSDTPLMLHIAYPLGTTFTITANAAWCTPDQYYKCQEVFTQASSVAAVRSSLGNTYFMDPTTGILSVRIIQFPQTFTGRPNWFLPNATDPGKWGAGFAVERFERAGVYLPMLTYGPWLSIDANCAVGTGDLAPFCAQLPLNVFLPVCSSGYQQVAYDKCCSTSDPLLCMYANGKS